MGKGIGALHYACLVMAGFRRHSLTSLDGRLFLGDVGMCGDNYLSCYSSLHFSYAYLAKSSICRMARVQDS